MFIVPLFFVNTTDKVLVLVKLSSAEPKSPVGGSRAIFDKLKSSSKVIIAGDSKFSKVNHPCLSEYLKPDSIKWVFTHTKVLNGKPLLKAPLSSKPSLFNFNKDKTLITREKGV